MPPCNQGYSYFSSSSDQNVANVGLNPAATAKFGRSPTLIRAIPSDFPLPLPFYLRILARISALLVPSLFYMGPLLLSSPVFLLLVSIRAGLGMFALNLVLVFCPVRPWPLVRRFFQLWYPIYDFHHNIDLSINHEKNYMEDSSLSIYSTHPHGVIPIHGYLWCAFCEQNFPNRYGFGALTDIAMRLPLLRHVMGWLSSSSATKKVLMKRMNAGENLYILPGGVSEIFMACPGKNVIKKPRRGLMKLALQTGAILVPTYVFGANDFYKQLATIDQCSEGRSGEVTNFFGRFQSKISRLVRGGFTIFWGQYGSPLPYQVKCSMVLGDPIEPVLGTFGQGKTLSGGKLTCKQIQEPTDKEIDDLQYRYTDALIRLFEQYKKEAGYPDAELILK